MIDASKVDPVVGIQEQISSTHRDVASKDLFSHPGDNIGFCFRCERGSVPDW
jgi:hypothetical protein